MSVSARVPDGSPVEVVVNGDRHALPAGSTVDDVVERFGFDRRGLAIAVGDEIVPRGAWPARRLQDGDEIEVLTIAQGG